MKTMKMLLIEKYKPNIITILKEIKSKYSIIGYEIADLYQEGLLGLIEAINSYDDNMNTTFYTYSTVCVRNRILSTIRSSFRQKNKVLNTSYSLDNILGENNETYYNLLEDNSYEPSHILIGNEEENSIIEKLNEKLSENEKEIFNLRLKGLKNSEICDLLNKDKKYIENAMNRINKKYREIIGKEK